MKPERQRNRIPRTHLSPQPNGCSARLKIRCEYCTAIGEKPPRPVFVSDNRVRFKKAEGSAVKSALRFLLLL